MTRGQVQDQSLTGIELPGNEARAVTNLTRSEPPVNMSLSPRQRVRELALKAASIAMRPALPLIQRVRRLFWTASVHANARSVGPAVHAYGPVRFLGTRNVSLGGWGNLYRDVLLETVDHGTIEIGDDFAINRGALLAAHERITIGDHAMIAEYVSIRDNGHSFADPMTPMRHQGYDVAPIRIGNDVWIGRGAVVLKGVTIGDGAIIAANAVVTKNVPAGEIWAGIPARFLRRRDRTATTP
jgi:acetyltransferase-like isoleucine patch superfamily enzyme